MRPAATLAGGSPDEVVAAAITLSSAAVPAVAVTKTGVTRQLPEEAARTSWTTCLELEIQKTLRSPAFAPPTTAVMPLLIDAPDIPTLEFIVKVYPALPVHDASTILPIGPIHTTST